MALKDTVSPRLSGVVVFGEQSLDISEFDRQTVFSITAGSPVVIEDFQNLNGNQCIICDLNPSHESLDRNIVTRPRLCSEALTFPRADTLWFIILNYTGLDYGLITKAQDPL